MPISPSAASRVCGVDVEFKNFNSGKAAMLPQRLAVIGIGNDDAVYGPAKYEVSSAAIVGDRYGYGSPLHLAIKQLFPTAGASATFPVTVYPLQKAAEAIPAQGSISAAGSATANGSGAVHVGGVTSEFPWKKGDTHNTILASIKNAINGTLEAPAKAGNISEGVLPITSKWSGESSNDITLTVDAIIPGVDLTIEGFSGGALDPDITPALTRIGVVWETQILDTFSYKKASRLDTYLEFGDGRWGSLEKKPILVAHGCTDDLETRTAITDPRKNDFINYLIPSVGSRELPFVIAAKGLLNDIMTTANNNPPQGYKGLLTSLHCGDDSVQENYGQRDSSVKKGSSTNIKNGSVAELNDIITFWHPESEGPFPSRRYVVDLVKLQNIVFNVRLIMEADALKGAPLLKDDQPTNNRTAVQPKTIKTSFINLADSLALNAILAESEFTKKNLTVKLDGANPKRINNTFPSKLSGNVEISDSLVQFGFLLGGE